MAAIDYITLEIKFATLPLKISLIALLGEGIEILSSLWAGCGAKGR